MTMRHLALALTLVLTIGCTEEVYVFDIFDPDATGASSTASQAEKAKTGRASAIPADLDEISDRGVLRAITSYGGTSYFIYKGETMGYEYELLKLLADELALELEIIIASDLNTVFDTLNRGEGDILAYGMTVTKERAESVAFTEHHNTTRQVLVQSKPDNWRKMKLHNIEKALIRNPLDLIGKTVHVRKNSPYYARIENLSSEMGGDIVIAETPGDVTTEELISRVADRKIKYTVADEQIAMINASLFPDIDIKTPVSFPQRIAWAVRRSSPELLKRVNGWIEEMRKETDYYVIYNRYFKSSRDFATRAGSEYMVDKDGGRISKYDDLIKECSKDNGWDWRLVASIVCQESRFDPKAKSWVGAKGLMQLMPKTATAYGATNPSDPHEGLLAGTKYLAKLYRDWSGIPDIEERKKFALASYNAGKGHVEDAQRLAIKHGKDKSKWDDDVAEYMLKLSNRKFFSDKAVRYGYCQGEQPVRYVSEILDRYNHYKNFVEE
ncbi:transglycosylase SLT domain-containing protein [Candidatus Hydrogenedentota bacterium]